MTVTLDSVIQNLVANTIVDLLDVSAPGSLEIYDDPTPGSGTKQATMTLSNPGYAAASGGTASLTATVSDSSIAAGDGAPGSFQAKDGSGTVVFEGTAGGASDDIDFSPDDTGWAAGATARVTQLDISSPA